MENDILKINSLAIYSSWAYYKPLRTLFDCGEGCATSFKNEIYGIERIFISHGHGDHINGLLSFVSTRNSVRGDKEKPLDVYYPKGSWSIRNLIECIEKSYRNLKFDLRFIAIDENFELSLTPTKKIRCFKMDHMKNGMTLGYKVVETRTRLKEQFVGKNIPELIKSGINKDDMTESYEFVEFAYCLDSCGFDKNEIKGCRLAVMDCTFINKDDRDDMTHFTLDEVVKLCDDAGVENVICAHISPRYARTEVSDAFSKLNNKYKYIFSK